MDMFCPKCGQSFEKGSRRFCPTDGRRLISDEPTTEAGRGVFANLIPQMDAISDLETTRPTVSPASTPQPAAEELSDVFFELDEPATDPFVKTSRGDSVSQAAVRKVSLYDIPAGHVELGDADRMPPLDFDETNPEGFVGRIVKGRYKVTEFLGGDENGLAFVADDKIVEDKKVVVRILTGDGRDEITESIMAEERISLSHLSHPNIARLVDSGQFTDGTPFLVSEYVDALSVHDILSIHGQFDGARTARIIRQAAVALNEAHQEGILHRDVRPENIIVDPTGESEHITLVNFGASDGSATPHSFAYRAPEVLDGRASTAASDIYSLGVVAFQMLTGRLPFTGQTTREMMRAQANGPVVNVSDANIDLPSSVNEVFDKALAYNAGNRFLKARDLGDALANALTSAPQSATAAGEPTTAFQAGREDVTGRTASPADVRTAAPRVIRTETVQPAAEPAWKNRSPEPPAAETSRTKMFAGIGLALLVTLLVLGWYLIVRDSGPQEPASSNDTQVSNTIVPTTEMPPLPRTIPQPPDTNFYQNSKQNLKGDLLINFVGFTLFYPKDWKVNGPQPGTAPNSRGKFLDISRNTADDRMQEQMLISYYPSKGTYGEDAEKFPMMVKETNETLRKILPGYMEISEGPIRLNGGWQAYEVKFQAGGKSPSGEKLTVWGRRLFIPAARPGVKNGFEITMLATSLAEEIQNVDDVGVRGELAGILFSFEPSQNF